MFEIRSPIRRVYIGKTSVPHMTATFTVAKTSGGNDDLVVDTKKATNSDDFLPIAVAAAEGHYKASGRVRGFLVNGNRRMTLGQHGQDHDLHLDAVLQVYDSREAADLAEENALLRKQVDELERRMARVDKLIEYVRETL